MSDLGQIPPKDQTNYLLGRLEGSFNALQASVAASAASQMQANTQHETEHAEFRRDIAKNASDIAVLNDNKQAAQVGRAQSIQKWIGALSVPGALAVIVGGFAWFIANHP